MKGIPNKRQKRHLRDSINNRIKAGKLERPMFCEGCGSAGVIEAHHENYNRPDDITWLCKTCHELLHADADQRAWALIDGTTGPLVDWEMASMDRIHRYE